MIPHFQTLSRIPFAAPTIGFTRFLLRLLGRRVVMLLLLHLFVFRQLLLLILVLVFLATLVSHASSFFSDCDLSLGSLRSNPRTNATTISVRASQRSRTRIRTCTHKTVQCKAGVSPRAGSLLHRHQSVPLSISPFQLSMPRAKHRGSKCVFKWSV